MTLSRNIVLRNAQLISLHFFTEEKSEKNILLSTDLFLRKHHLSKHSPNTFEFKKTVINRLSFIQQKRNHSLIFTEQEKSS